MPIINQPFQEQLGNLLKIELMSDYNLFTIFTAFAKNSGVLRLKESLKKYKAAGGIIKAFVGIDLDGTSYEALLNLFCLCDELYVIHSENFSTTYHSKIYLLENSKRAWCAVGSNNLTGGGLWTNFESCSIQTYTLPDAYHELEPVYSVMEKYIDPSYPCSTRISSVEEINALFHANYISKEVTQKMDTVSKRVLQKAKQKKTPLFGVEKIMIPTVISVQSRIVHP